MIAVLTRKRRPEIHRVVHKTADLIDRGSPLVRGLRRVYESFEGWSALGKGVTFRINGLEFRRDPHCRNRFPDNFAYEAEVAAFLSKRVKPGNLCLDVGANVGYYALQLARWSGPCGRVAAFEPNPGPRAVLERLITLNHLESRVSVLPVAVGARPGKATLYIPQDERCGLDGISRLGEPAKELGSASSTVEVEVITLDDYCTASCSIPDWILIDIEGFELAALSGAKKLIAERKSQLGLVVEMHPDLWPEPSGSGASAASVLNQLGLRPEPLTGQKDPLAERGVVNLVSL